MTVPSPLDIAIRRSSIIDTFRSEIQIRKRLIIPMLYIHRAKRVNDPVVNRIVPLIGGIHFPIGLSARRFGMEAAIVPATKRGIICPKPKHVNKAMPVKGFPFCATHPRSIANTGVVHGEAARPNANPAAIGARGGGTRSSQI